jgi:hypothetical protein
MRGTRSGSGRQARATSRASTIRCEGNGWEVNRGSVGESARRWEGLSFGSGVFFVPSFLSHLILHLAIFLLLFFGVSRRSRA